MVRKMPQRTCVGCRQVITKRQLVRIMRTPDGHVEIDHTGKRAGRGAYLCGNRTCWRRALDQKQLHRALKITLTQEDADMLRAYGDGLPELPDMVEAGKP